MSDLYETHVPDQYRAMACYAHVVGAGVYDLRRVDASALIAYYGSSAAMYLASTFGDVIGRLSVPCRFEPSWRLHESTQCDERAIVTDAIVNGNVETSFDAHAEVNR